MKTSGQLLSIGIGIYALILTASLAYYHFGLLGVIVSIVIPISLLIAPVYILIAAGNPVPFVIIASGSIMAWWLQRERVSTSTDSYSLIESVPPIRNTSRANSLANPLTYREPKSKDEVKQRLEKEMQAIVHSNSRPGYHHINDDELDYLNLDELYKYAASKLSFMSEVSAETAMMFAGIPAFDLGIPATMVDEFDKWYERLFRAERGLPIIPRTKEQPEKPESASGSELLELIERLASLKDSGAITEEDFQQKKEEILKRL